MREVPRDAFVEPGFEEFAYEDGALPIGEGQTISQPYIAVLNVPIKSGVMVGLVKQTKRRTRPVLLDNLSSCPPPELALHTSRTAPIAARAAACRT